MIGASHASRWECVLHVQASEERTVDLVSDSGRGALFQYSTLFVDHVVLFLDN
jgi:hypothetical protein